MPQFYHVSSTNGGAITNRWGYSQRHRRPIRAQARHQSQPSALSATPATWNEGGCRQVPRLPRETKMDVAKCHACHAKRRWMWVCATPATQSAAASRASRATKPVQARHPVPWVPRLPRKTTVDVRLCHACHAKRRWMSGCATPATQSAAASPATNPGPSAPPEPAIYGYFGVGVWHWVYHTVVAWSILISHVPSPLQLVDFTQ